MKHILNSVTKAYLDNLRGGLSSDEKIDAYYKLWSCTTNYSGLQNIKGFQKIFILPRSIYYSMRRIHNGQG